MFGYFGVVQTDIAAFASFRQRRYRATFWVALFAALWVLTACSFDDDSRYVEQPRRVFFRAADTAGITPLYFWADGNVTDLRAVATLPALISQLTVAGREFWVACPADSTLRAVDVLTFQEVKRYTLPIAAHYFALGDRDILLVDTAARNMAWLDRTTEAPRYIVEPLDGKPGAPLHLSERFFLPLDAQRLRMFNASALSAESTYVCTYPLAYLAITPQLSIACFLQTGGQLYQQTLTPTTRQLGPATLRTGLARAYPSPYLNARLGTEWLTEVTLNHGRVNATGMASTIRFVGVDFQYSRLWAQTATGDTLIGHDLRRALAFTRIVLPHRVVEAAYWAGR
jgi:hypothetical protein